ncbi:MAG TPA: L-lactate permease, partial [Gaiellales bacterium]|nr:L-lactate permease [Gaiellales bacterium]
MFTQSLDPVGGSLFLSAICGALPLLVLFVLLGGLRVKAWAAGLISLVVALLVAVVLFEMPPGDALLAASQGAAFGFFPILWIVINAIWVYNLTVASGHFDVLRRSFEKVSPDQRIQAIIIAFCFGALLEALAGFGTPVAITVVMLLSLGFKPLKAATVSPDMRIQAIIIAFCFGALLEALAGFGTPVAITVVMLMTIGFSPLRAAALSLIANTAPVAFGALAAPITALATVAHGANPDPRLTIDTLGAMVGRQTPILAAVVPLVLVFVADGRRGLR